MNRPAGVSLYDVGGGIAAHPAVDRSRGKRRTNKPLIMDNPVHDDAAVRDAASSGDWLVAKGEIFLKVLRAKPPIATSRGIAIGIFAVIALYFQVRPHVRAR
jgi:hypothetical protein